MYHQKLLDSIVQNVKIIGENPLEIWDFGQLYYQESSRKTCCFDKSQIIEIYDCLRNFYFPEEWYIDPPCSTE
jgi:hypothetical protein